MTQKSSPQLTVRACIIGMILGGVMCLSNLYVGLKTGWSFGAAITAGILAFALFSVLHKSRIIKTPFGILENNAMQSVASAAGYMTAGGNVSAIPAMMMISGFCMTGWQMFFWITITAFLGVVVAIPMKQQMINVEKLAFPSGLAAAETLKALHGEGDSGNDKAKLLGWGGLIGAFIAFFRDAEAKWMPFNIPDIIPIFPGVRLAGRPLRDYTLAFEGSTILMAAGAIMGFRAAWSMFLGNLIGFGGLAPWLYSHGIIAQKLGYRSIVTWTVWIGSSMLLTSGLLSFAMQWQTVVRAVKSVGKAFGAPTSLEELGEVPMHWFFIGVAVFSPMVVFLEWFIFGISPWLGCVSVVLSFFTAIVASRATGETDITPSGALGKIGQLTFGMLAHGSTTTNLMATCVGSGVGLHAADLLTDLKSGHILKADPKQQFWAQFFGVIAGSVFVVPAFQLLVPNASVLGTEKWPAPSAQTWKAVAELLSNGLETLHPTARIGILVGASLGIILVLLEKYFPEKKKWIPSPTGLGLGFTLPGNNTLAFFIGALVSLVMEKKTPKLAERMIIPVSSGLIAGESLMAVVIALMMVMGWLGS